MEGGVMKMRPVAGGLEIKPGADRHARPERLSRDVRRAEGASSSRASRFKATLEFAKAGKVDVDFVVEGIGAKAPGGDHDMPGMGGMQMK